MATSATRILVLDNDEATRDLMADQLVINGFDILLAATAEQARQLLDQHQTDLVVMDVMLAGEDGMGVCRHLCSSRQLPVIIVSAMATEMDRIIGLEMGADDYVAKPFHPREMLARIRAVLRRGIEPAGVAPLANRYEFDDWQLDVRHGELSHRCKEQLVKLSTGEARLLEVLLAFPNQALSRAQLMNLVRGRDSLPFERGIDNTISRLRRKMEADPANPRLIKTEWGSGYKLVAEVRSY